MILFIATRNELARLVAADSSNWIGCRQPCPLSFIIYFHLLFCRPVGGLFSPSSLFFSLSKRPEENWFAQQLRVATRRHDESTHWPIAAVRLGQEIGGEATFSWSSWIARLICFLSSEKKNKEEDKCPHYRPFWPVRRSPTWTRKDARYTANLGGGRRWLTQRSAPLTHLSTVGRLLLFFSSINTWLETWITADCFYFSIGFRSWPSDRAHSLFICPSFSFVAFFICLFFFFSPRFSVYSFHSVPGGDFEYKETRVCVYASERSMHAGFVHTVVCVCWPCDSSATVSQAFGHFGQRPFLWNGQLVSSGICFENVRQHASQSRPPSIDRKV